MKPLYSLMRMDQTYKEGATVLMIDSQMFDNIVSYSGLFTQSHRIVYEGGLTFFNDNNESIRNVGNETELFFLFATWGCSPDSNSQMLSKYDNIYVRCFKSTFYDFIICRNTLGKNNNIYGFILQNINEKSYLCHCWIVFIFNMYLQEMQV